jgi:hypothetical protein
VLSQKCIFLLPIIQALATMGKKFFFSEDYKIIRGLGFTQNKIKKQQFFYTNR